MRGTVWAWASALIGAAILVLIFFYGTEYGTWVDEAGPLSVEPPTFILPFAIGGLGFVLLIGGVIAGSTGMLSAERSGRKAKH
ncbi:hypothetical protein [Arthrobacter sp. NtRootA1]|uniref:hypothetical protein n=1 Tax=Micrococcaceae TaxID=1268 RepID=UPI001CC8205D|nr:hypothetical protein [Arthrobacter sp. NtRootA1]BCW08333.1 hypothetical protein NtRootA1_44710 [Arthrobacter sp. NtRootA1]